MDPDLAVTNQHAGLPEGRTGIETTCKEKKKNKQLAAARKGNPGRPPTSRIYFQPAENCIDPVVLDVLPPDPPSDGEAWVKPIFRHGKTMDTEVPTSFKINFNGITLNVAVGVAGSTYAAFRVARAMHFRLQEREARKRK